MVLKFLKNPKRKILRFSISSPACEEFTILLSEKLNKLKNQQLFFVPSEKHGHRATSASKIVDKQADSENCKLVGAEICE